MLVAAAMNLFGEVVFTANGFLPCGTATPSDTLAHAVLPENHGNLCIGEAILLCASSETG